MENNVGDAIPKHSMHFSRSGGEERIGKLNVRTTVTSEQQKSNVLLEKCSLKLILLVQKYSFHTCGAERLFLRMMGCFIIQMQTVAHACETVLTNTGFAELL